MGLQVRALEIHIESALSLCPGGLIRGEHLPEGLAKGLALAAPDSTHAVLSAGGQPQELPGRALPPSAGSMENIKRRAAQEALSRHGGRVMAACRELGVSKDTLRRILRKGAGEER